MNAYEAVLEQKRSEPDQGQDTPARLKFLSAGMVISASRRTDIPAFYGPWFLRRLEEGYALVRNPVNQRLVYRVPISPGRTRCIVFWTKNPGSLMGRLDELDSYGIPYYFLFTVTGYGPELERELPEKRRILRTFVDLAGRLGPERVVWRYDPILFTRDYSPSAHIRLFRQLARGLAGSTRRCILSYITMYNKCRRNMSSAGLVEISAEGKKRLALEIQSIAARYGMQLHGCACPELTEAGIPAGRCVDDSLISRITGREFTGKKDRSQREACGCVESVDIGAYDTCVHHCLYCYANAEYRRAQEHRSSHDPESPLLYGRVGEEDRISQRG